MEGKVVVDGILVSCYADFGHDVAHFTMTPMHWFPKIIEWAFSEDYGFSAFVSMARGLGMQIMPNGQFFS